MNNSSTRIANSQISWHMVDTIVKWAAIQTRIDGSDRHHCVSPTAVSLCQPALVNNDIQQHEIIRLGTREVMNVAALLPI